jgi:hypothetical protein
MKSIYAIYDNVAEQIIGGLHVFPHQAPAIRMYGDIAAMPDSTIGKHPHDFDLIQVGILNDDTTITPVKETVLTGAQWSAAQLRTREDTDAS